MTSDFALNNSMISKEEYLDKKALIAQKALQAWLIPKMMQKLL